MVVNFCLGCCGLFAGFRGVFVGGKGDVGAGFEELLPEFGALPYCGGVLGVLFDDGKYAGCDYSVSAAEVVVDFWKAKSIECRNIPSERADLAE